MPRGGKCLIVDINVMDTQWQLDIFSQLSTYECNVYGFAGDIFDDYPSLFHP